MHPANTLMDITIKSHDNAPLNPKAQYKATIQRYDAVQNQTGEGKRRARCQIGGTRRIFYVTRLLILAIAWPMHLFDCCPISDGAACILLVGKELAKHFTDDPLYVAGVGQASGRGLNAADDLTYFEATRHAANEAYEISGLTPADIQFRRGCTTVSRLRNSCILKISDFSSRGEGYKAVADGLTRLDGEKPINTSGGLKCKGHPVGATGAAQLIEVWEQLRDKAGDRASGRLKTYASAQRTI